MKYAFINAAVLDGSENMQPTKNTAVLVEDGIIKAIEPSADSFGDVEMIDLEGRYLMPGLINLHVHLPGSGMPSYTKKQNAKTVNFLMSNIVTRSVVYSLCYKFARTQLMSGVTTIRTVGGLGNIDSSIRNDINKGKRIGPRMLVSDMAVSVPEGHMAGLLAYEAKTEDDCVRYVRKIAENKPDLIKIMITGGVLDAKVKGEPGVLKMPPELVRACCNEAHRLGYKVAAHIESPAGLHAALENGVDTVEHGADPDEVYMGNPHLDDGSPETGYYCFAGPIVQAANAYLAVQGSSCRAYDLTGAEEAELASQLQAGNPVIFWATLHFGDIQHDPCGEYDLPGGRRHEVLHTLHCMVLCGMDDQNFVVADPLDFNRVVPRVQFMKIYRQLGRRAVVIKKDS